MSEDDALQRAMVEALDGDWGDERFEIAATLLPVVTAYADRRARERAVEELRAAADWLAAGAAERPGPLRMVARKLHDRADALAPPDGGWAWRRTATGWASDALAADDQAQR